ncbi:hypothetical protein A2303_01380 [Candidatus Falkowbacteria bacterium RIFOXYB2_FULL_47_14]|uniref:Uncharacterized protein n=1 Tax=Candidatus Falkowbacteria bacterium RIFOXYA2_FULL_47_19 TaxID=1797994 RepID=A0A1F5SH63_9BACT|nr:MAG: hypothetical protein A2227_05675 [Candidatus Falkowbacteria bacterium RIFOXYA2_FULL_47_19]OGF34503.1 MAG: hypothetical protein A2468_04720 [Candidatus Falkowbacteria bacterium RIFOXYC2_FULL_46_15]OGF43541.1 MAG: hypothetical protein A2303_01380 [Candidatus Falkowbacteria bacterium RIFOXYB2_FULL_47_14]
MNKFLLFLLLLSVFALSACSGGTAQTGTLGLDGKGPDDFRRPDFGQPDREPDIRGLVKSITGNEVTILKIERPDLGNAEGNNESDAAANPDQPNGDRAFVVSGGTGGGGERRGGGFVMMGGPGGAGGAGTTDRAAMLKQLEAMSTGSETVTIPVGIQMLKPDTANAKDATTGGRGTNMNMIEASLSDIQAEKMLSIWLDEGVTDRKVASFVLVMR